MTHSSAVYQRRRVVAIVVLAACAALIVFAITQLTGSNAAEPTKAAGATRRPRRPRRRRRSRVELPRGGRTILPDFRVVAYYGAPQDKQLGALGIGKPAQAAKKLERAAKPFARKSRPVLPAMELIAVVAAAHPGPGDRYNLRQPDSVIRRYLKAARKAKTLLILDIQPGRSDFFTETKRLRKWLKEPDVGLALDPEWRMGPGQVPGQVIGRVGAREVNATTRVARPARDASTSCRRSSCSSTSSPTTWSRRRELKPRKGLAYVLNVDGFGGQALKIAKYKGFAAQAGEFRRGFKLFYHEEPADDDPRAGHAPAAAAGRRRVRMSAVTASENTAARASLRAAARRRGRGRARRR